MSVVWVADLVASSACACWSLTCSECTTSFDTSASEPDLTLRVWLGSKLTWWKSMEVSGSHWKPTTACVCSRRELSGVVGSHWEPLGVVRSRGSKLPNQSTWERRRNGPDRVGLVQRDPLRMRPLREELDRHLPVLVGGAHVEVVEARVLLLECVEVDLLQASTDYSF